MRSIAYFLMALVLSVSTAFAQTKSVPIPVLLYIESALAKTMPAADGTVSSADVLNAVRGSDGVTTISGVAKQNGLNPGSDNHAYVAMLARQRGIPDRVTAGAMLQSFKVDPLLYLISVESAGNYVAVDGTATSDAWIKVAPLPRPKPRVKYVPVANPEVEKKLSDLQLLLLGQGERRGLVADVGSNTKAIDNLETAVDGNTSILNGNERGAGLIAKVDDLRGMLLDDDGNPVGVSPEKAAEISKAADDKLSDAFNTKLATTVGSLIGLALFLAILWWFLIGSRTQTVLKQTSGIAVKAVESIATIEGNSDAALNQSARTAARMTSVEDTLSDQGDAAAALTDDMKDLGRDMCRMGENLGGRMTEVEAKLVELGEQDERATNAPKKGGTPKILDIEGYTQKPADLKEMSTGDKFFHHLMVDGSRAVYRGEVVGRTRRGDDVLVTIENITSEPTSGTKALRLVKTHIRDKGFSPVPQEVVA